MIPSPLLAQITGALISAIVALSALFFTLRENRKLQKERRSDEQILAERKFGFDKALVDIRRKAELAEKALAFAYEARDVIRSARSPGIRAGEGESRNPQQPEGSDIADRRRVYFVPIERLTRESEVFGRLQSQKYPFAAYFGDLAAQPFADLIMIHHEIISAASILVQMAPTEGLHGVSDNLSLRQTAFATADQPDQIARKVDAAIEALEAVCGPVLSRMVSQELSTKD